MNTETPLTEALKEHFGSNLFAIEAPWNQNQNQQQQDKTNRFPACIYTRVDDACSKTHGNTGFAVVHCYHLQFQEQTRKDVILCEERALKALEEKRIITKKRFLREEIIPLRNVLQNFYERTWLVEVYV